MSQVYKCLSNAHMPGGVSAVDVEGRCTLLAVGDLNSLFGKSVLVRHENMTDGANMMLTKMSVDHDQFSQLCRVSICLQCGPQGWKPPSTVSSMPKVMADALAKPNKRVGGRAFWDEP